LKIENPFPFPSPLFFLSSPTPPAARLRSPAQRAAVPAVQPARAPRPNARFRPSQAHLSPQPIATSRGWHAGPHVIPSLPRRRSHPRPSRGRARVGPRLGVRAVIPRGPARQGDPTPLFKAPSAPAPPNPVPRATAT
jgi:hypothetical protein